jgi:hypothetical protein
MSVLDANTFYYFYTKRITAVGGALGETGPSGLV